MSDSQETLDHASPTTNPAGDGRDALTQFVETTDPAGPKGRVPLGFPPRANLSLVAGDLTLSYVVADSDRSIQFHPGILSAAFSSGGLLHDRYVLERELGRGGMGLVYLGRDRRLDRPVAVKIILPQTEGNSPGDTLDSRLRASFAEEARIGASLTHPAIATVFDYGIHDGSPFTVFEYIPGETLRDLLRRRKKMEVDEVRLIVTTMAQALDFAHARHVVHRDLKPENIRATEQGQFKVLDLGLAKDFHRQSDWSFCGTPAYASPEQAAGLPCDGRTDQYALAVIAFELLTGRRPFEASSWKTLLEKHVNEPPPSPQSIRADLPDAIGRAILRALSKDPNDRFGNCEEFAVAMGGFFLSAPAPVPEVLSEATVLRMKGPLRSFTQMVSLSRSKIHLLLTSDSLWVWYRSDLTRIPVAAISDVRRRRFSKLLRVQIHTPKGLKWQKFQFKRRKEGREWRERIAGLIAELPPQKEAVTIEPTRTDPVVLLPSRPVARFQLLGPLEAKGRKKWISRAGLQIRGAMVGADAVVDVRDERLSGFIRSEKRTAGMSLKAVDGDGRAELKYRWFDGEASRLGAWMLALTSLTFLGAMVMLVAALAVWVLQSNNHGAPAVFDWQISQTLPSVARYTWPFVLTLAFFLLRWPQLARSATLVMATMAAASFLSLLTTALGGFITIRAMISSSYQTDAAIEADLRGFMAKIGITAILGVIVYVVNFGFVLAYMILLIFLGKRSWKAEKELRLATPDAPRKAPAIRRYGGAFAFAMSCACLIGTMYLDLFSLANTAQPLWMDTPTSAGGTAGTIREQGEEKIVRTGVTVTNSSSSMSSLAFRERMARASIVAKEESLRRNPNDPAAQTSLRFRRMALLRILVLQSDLPRHKAEEAMKLAEAAVASDQKNPLVINLRGAARYRLQDFDGALRDLEVAQTPGSPDDPFALFFLALVHARKDQPEKARDAYNRAVAAMERNPRFYSDLIPLKDEASRLVKPPEPPPASGPRP